MKKLTILMIIVVVIRFVMTIYTGMSYNHGLGLYGYILVPVFSPIYFSIIMIDVVDLKRDLFLEIELAAIHLFTFFILGVDYYFYTISI